MVVANAAAAEKLKIYKKLQKSTVKTGQSKHLLPADLAASVGDTRSKQGKNERGIKDH